MNNWIKGLLGAGVFFLLMIIIGYSSSNPMESGENFGKILFPLILVVLGLKFGYDKYKKQGFKKK